MDVKCPGCFNITTVFSHAQTVVICSGCSTVLCQPTGGKARLMEGMYFIPTLIYVTDVVFSNFLWKRTKLSWRPVEACV